MNDSILLVQHEYGARIMRSNTIYISRGARNDR